MKNLIKDIIKELVDSPEEVDVEEIKTNSTAVINIKVAKIQGIGFANACANPILSPP